MPRTFHLGEITGVLATITMLAFTESALFVYGVATGIGLDLTIYMQPLDYVIITPSWLWQVVFLLPCVICIFYLDILLKIEWRVLNEFAQRTKRFVKRLHPLSLRNRFGYVMAFACGPLVWIGVAIFVMIAISRTSGILSIRPTPITSIPLHFWAGFGPPALAVRLFVWLLRKYHFLGRPPYLRLLLAFIASLPIAALTYGHFDYAVEAITSKASTHISLKAEAGEHYDRTVRGTILFRLTDRLLVLSPEEDSKTIRPRSIIVVPLAEVRLIEATQ
jgi:hypothetical protein